MQDIRQSENYSKYLSSIGWKVEKINNIYFYIKNLFFFTTIKLQRPEEINKEITAELLNKHKGIVNFVIEPKEKLKIKGFKQTIPYLPSKTLILDLTKSEEEIHNNFSKDARYSIKKSQETINKIQTCDDLEIFYNAWKSSVPFGRYVLSVKELNKVKTAFGKNALFLLSEDQNAGSIFLTANGSGYYWQAFTSDKARKTLVQYSIVWEGIKWCKKRGAKYFDFEGIFDARFPLATWKGFTAFKKKFGGVETEFPGAYQKWFVNF